MPAAHKVTQCTCTKRQRGKGRVLQQSYGASFLMIAIEIWRKSHLCIFVSHSPLRFITGAPKPSNVLRCTIGKYDSCNHFLHLHASPTTKSSWWHRFSLFLGSQPPYGNILGLIVADWSWDIGGLNPRSGIFPIKTIYPNSVYSKRYEKVAPCPKGTPTAIRLE